jgi:WXG100 family type VII secretion target
MRQAAQGPAGYVPPAGGVGSGFETDLHVMLSAQGYVEHVGQVMVSEVNRLMANLEALGPSTWDGDAARAFAKAKHDWQRAQADLTKALQDIALGLDGSRKQYDQADTDSQLGITSAVRGLTFG